MENCVPIIEITDENFTQMWSAISTAISQASFIALDCELSGLGDRSKLSSSEIDVRYLNIKEVAQEFSIVSLGISCFMCQSCSPLAMNPCNGEEHMVKSHNYLVQTFNILTLCSTKYSVESRSAKFLLSHGFDFNNQFTHGLLYERGEDLQIGKDKGNAPSVKQIFQLIIKHEKPIVLHNGFIDLLFMYQSFYAELPKNSDTFAADLLEMFPAGIYDTKYISEFHQSFPATFLEYIFKSLQIENLNRDRKELWHCRLKFLPYPKQIHGLKWHYYMQVFEQGLEESTGDQPPLCESYKYHGWCSQGDSCEASHNINRIVRELHESPNKKRKKATNGIAASSTASSMAQLINMKKQKMEETKRSQSLPENGNCLKKLKKNSSSLDSGFRCTNTVISPINCNITRDNDVDCKILQTGHNGTSGVYKSNSVKVNNIEIKFDIDHTNGHLNNSSELESRRIYSSIVNEPPEKSPSDNFVPSVNRYADCGGHSAGMDAFMTGFIFACDVASMGTVPKVASFGNARDLDLHHVVGKVYLIGKEFPFLVRSSSYHRTSPMHDKMIKLLRTK